ncbi:MAG: isoprenylcysteine carboxylmethyltransferase family protein [Verrucomicrobiota bacterium]
MPDPAPQPPDDPHLNFVQRRGDAVPAETTGWAGAAGFLAALVITQIGNFSPLATAGALLLATLLPMLAVEMLGRGVHRRATSGLGAPPRREFHPERCRRKYVGFLATLSALLFLYWLLPNYGQSAYRPVYILLATALPLLLALGPLYLLSTDRRQTEPEDTMYRIGTWLATGQMTVHGAELRAYALAWTIKGFFLPVMLSFLFINLRSLQEHGFGFATFTEFYFSVMAFIFLLDVTFGSLGYLCTSRWLDAQIRASDATALGWVATLACYPPFMLWVGQGFTGLPRDAIWQEALYPYPFLAVTWGFAILVLLAVYVWATICFGCRFSNLTNRGIITYGPYRYTKHPAYLAKCTNWWLLSCPFLLYGSLELILKATLLLALKCAIYIARARQEERLLGQDPAYRLYATWINQHGLWAELRRWWHGLKPAGAPLASPRR